MNNQFATQSADAARIRGGEVVRSDSIMINTQSEIRDLKSVGPGAIAAWTSAALVEASPKKKAPPPTP